MTVQLHVVTTQQAVVLNYETSAVFDFYAPQAMLHIAWNGGIVFTLFVPLS